MKPTERRLHAHYDKLSDLERFRVAVAAYARDDDGELDELRRTAPRDTYRISWAYHRQWAALFECVQVALLDIASWGGMLGWIVPLLFWGVLLVGLVIGILWLVRVLRRTSSGTTSTEAPLDAARRRLALGEITIGEFDEIAQRLEVRSATVDR